MAFDNMDKLINDLLDDLVELDENGEYIFANRLRGRDGKKLINQFEIAEYMRLNGLINIEPTQGIRCLLTNRGKEISGNGGWLKYLEEQEKIEMEKSQKKAKKEELESKILELTEINLRLQNRQLRRQILYAIIGFGAGFIAANWQTILILTNILNPGKLK